MLSHDQVEFPILVKKSTEVIVRLKASRHEAYDVHTSVTGNANLAHLVKL